MSADRDAVALGARDRAAHRDRIPGVETTGHVRRGDDGHELVVGSAPPGPEALSQVGVEVHGGHDGPSHCSARASALAV